MFITGMIHNTTKNFKTHQAQVTDQFLATSKLSTNTAIHLKNGKKSTLTDFYRPIINTITVNAYTRH